MSRIEIDLPAELHRLMKARADEAGLSLSEYAVRELDEHESEKPTPLTKEEVLARLRGLTPVKGDFDVAELIREGREEREEELWQAIRGSFDDDRR